MFAKLAIVSLAIIAAATGAAAQECSTGAIQCCGATTTESSSPGLATLLGLLGIVAGGVNVPIGLECSPISVWFLAGLGLAVS